MNRNAYVPVICFFLAAAILVAQGERGTFNGTVTDVSGAVLPNAVVTATESQTNVETKSTTTDAGVYRMPALPSGVYQLSISAPGFRTTTQGNVTLRVAQTLTVDFKMEVGEVSDRVTVSAEAPLIETTSPEIGRYVSKREFDTWPVAVSDGQRQIQTFIFSSLPGAVGGTFQGSINGGQQYSHEILIEGMSLGRFDLNGGSNNEFSPSAEAVSEFKLQTGTIGAQYGGGQTSVANFAIKSGTNQLHGGVFTYVQNDALRANSFSNNAIGRPKPPFKLFNYGYGVGGPVFIPKVYDGRNKTFFYTNLENTRQRDFTSTGLITLPTIAFKRGDFSRLLNPAYTGNTRSGSVVGTDALGRPAVFGQIYDPSTTRLVNGAAVRDPFPGNIVPSGRWDPVSAKILQLAPITDPFNDNLLNNTQSINTCCPVFDERIYAVKVDHIFNSAHRMSAYYNVTRRIRNNSPGGRWGNPPGSPTDVYQLQSTPGHLARIAEDWTISPTVLNHLAVGYNRFGNFNESVYVDQDWASKIGLLNTAPTTFPRLQFVGQPILGGGIGAGGQLGSSSSGFSFNGSTIWQDDLTIVRGKHSFRVGTEIRYYYYNIRNKSGTGQFNFNSLQPQLPGFNDNTGHAFASFLLGAVDSTTRGITVTNPGFRTRAPSFYFADDWRVTKKLSLNLGLRWEIIGGIFEVAGRTSNLDPSKQNPGAGGLPGALVFADELGRKGFAETNYKQFSPRLGFAYAVSPTFVLRGGYGINNMSPVANFSLPSTFGYNGSITVNSANTPLQFPQDPVLYLHDRYPDFNGALPNKNPSLANGQGITYTARDSTRLGYVQNYNLGFQYQLPSEFVLDMAYIGNKGTRLTSRGLDALNQLPVNYLRFGDRLTQPLSANTDLAPLPYPGFNGTVAQALRRFPQYQGVGQYLPNFGFSTYNSLQVTATRHFTRGFALLAAYTFSKVVTNAESPIDNFNSQDVYNRGLERSVASFNVPQFLKLTWIYELPIGAGKLINVSGVAGKILGGWNVTGIHNYRSGDALAVGTSGLRGDAIFNGGYRPDVIGGVPQVTDQGGAIAFGTGTPYLNPAAFAQIPRTAGGIPLRLGTAPRYLPNVRGPGRVSEDFGLQKRFAFTETVNIEFRADAFNAFNRAGRGNPNTDVTSPLFGRITGPAYGPRSVQLELRFNF